MKYEHYAKINNACLVAILIWVFVGGMIMNTKPAIAFSIVAPFLAAAVWARVKMDRLTSPCPLCKGTGCICNEPREDH